MDLAKQLAIISRFGSQALRTNDLDALLHEAAALVADALGIKRVKVLELLPGGDALLVRSGVGWKPGVVGELTLGADHKSPAGYALQTGEPVICPDLGADRRFETPAVLLEHGIRSAANVIIRGDGPPFGVLEVDSEEPREYSAEEIHFLQNHANLLAAAIDRVRTHRALEQLAVDQAAAAEEREVLLRELQHRVKNNLQMIVSLIHLQQQRAETADARRQLEALAKRVQALSGVHRQLYTTGHATRAPLGGYLRELCESLLDFYGPRANGVRFDWRFADVTASADKALHLGLIANEFISNSLEHAFPEGRGSITVALERVEPERARLVLADDGPGLPASRVGGLGLQLITLLARQVGAELEWGDAESRGTRATLTFPV
jgi:two-component sensor histidine kinase